MKGDSRGAEAYAITPIVAAITELNFRGNIIPHTWWQADRLKLDTGKPNLMAILILSDICYWYRASEERDEVTGAVVRVRRRFKSDKLQRSYTAWAEQFGLGKRQVQRAIAFLIERGLIKRELRTVTTKGMPLSNVTFFEPVVNAVKQITCLPPIAKNGDTCGQQWQEVAPRVVIPHTRNGETCTEITEENTSKNTIERECVSQTPHITHTPPSQPSSKIKNIKQVDRKSKAKAKESPPDLTYDQSAALAILCAYFPTLAAAHHQSALARFIQEVAPSPYKAMLFCCWLVYRGRDFKFIKLSLLQDIWAEFELAESDHPSAKRSFGYATGSLAKARDVYDAWKERELIPEPAAA